MGCNKSLPLEAPISPQVHIQPTAPFMARKRTKRVNTQEVGSINEHFKILKAIGTNSTGTLFYAQDLQSGTFRAVREVIKSQINSTGGFYHEIEILKSLDHPNIQKTYQTIETTINYYVVYEYMDGESLKNTIKRTGNELLVAKYMNDVISAVYYMHVHGFIHCDISPAHVLFSNCESENIPKLISFSNAQSLGDMQQVDLKNLAYIYMSPEILRKNFTEKTDMWSIGVMVYELLVGKHPYLSKDKHDILKEIYNGTVDFTNSNFLSLSCSAQDFIKKLLQANPEDRLSSKEALAHPWLGFSSKEFYVSYEALMKLRTFKIKSNIAREIIQFFNSKLDFVKNEMIAMFKSMDADGDGNISNDEIVEAFKQVGVDASEEITAIMKNLDIDCSGTLDFTEITIALVEWDKVLKKKNLTKVFKSEDGRVSLDYLRHEFTTVLPHEWNEFAKRTKAENDMISLVAFKEYLKSQIDLA